MGSTSPDAAAADTNRLRIGVLRAPIVPPKPPLESPVIRQTNASAQMKSGDGFSKMFSFNQRKVLMMAEIYISREIAPDAIPMMPPATVASAFTASLWTMDQPRTNTFLDPSASIARSVKLLLSADR